MTTSTVGLIDADVYGPSQPTLLGSDAKPTAKDDQLIPVDAHGIRFLSLGQLVSPGHALAWRGPMATGALAKLVEAKERFEQQKPDLLVELGDFIDAAETAIRPIRPSRSGSPASAPTPRSATTATSCSTAWSRMARRQIGRAHV